MKLTVTAHDASGLPDHTPRCPVCGFVAKNATGLSSHERKHRAEAQLRAADAAGVFDGDAYSEIHDASGIPTADLDAMAAALSDDPQVASGQMDGMEASIRRCKGSATFGIEAHDALLADFPLQPSRKDGIGVMCRTHWREYTNALRKRAQGADEATPRDEAKQVRSVAAERSANTARARRDAIAVEAAKGRAKRAAAKAPVVDQAVADAARLIQDVDALPADEYVKRVGDDDVQAALSTLARGTAVAPLEPGMLGDGHAE